MYHRPARVAIAVATRAGLGAAGLPLVGRRTNHRAMHHALVVGYHHAGVPPPGVRHRYHVSGAALRGHVLSLRAQGYVFTTVSQALGATAERVACLTFDDGYEDNHTVALPVLRELGVVATVFVVTGDVGRRGLRWPEEKPGVAPADIMSWQALSELEDAGWEIGSHAHQHRRLARMTPDEQREQLARSFVTLAGKLRRPPRALAYPYGSYSRVTLEAARAAGFQVAATTRRGRVLPGDDPFQLRRISAHGTRPWHVSERWKLALAGRGLYPLRAAALEVQGPW